MFTPVILLISIAVVAAVILGIAAQVFYVEEDPRIDDVEGSLPGGLDPKI